MEPGIFKIIDLSNCESGGFCFYDNQITAYGRPIFKPTEDISEEEALLGVNILGPNDAVVVISTVPDSLYWSFIPYVWRKGEEAAGFGPVIQTNTGKESYVLFSSVNNGINNFDYPSATEIAVIMTRNAQVFEAERTAILSMFPNLIVAPVWIPTAVSYDSPVQLILRGTFFPPGGFQSYSENTNTKTYRVRWCNIGDTGVTLVLPGEEKKEIPPNTIPLYIKPLPTEPSELPMIDEFNRYVNDIISNYDVYEEIEVRPFLKEPLGKPISSGWDCFYNNIMCLADNPTSAYILSEDFMLNNQRSVLVCAVNHRITQRSFYTNLNIYDVNTEGSNGSYVPPSDELFYNFVWSLPEGTYRAVERAYIQLPENAAPSADTLILMRVFVINYVPDPPVFDGMVSLNLLNPNTEALRRARILMTGE